MKTGIIAAVVAVLVIGGGALLLTKNKKSDSATPATSQTSTNNAPANSATDNSSAANSQAATDNAASTITYSDSGFSPSSITVKSGSKVTIKNTSSHDMQFDSDPHPIHTDDTDLNVGVVAPGKSMEFTVNKKGTFGYHNHLNPNDTGTIIVQ